MGLEVLCSGRSDRERHLFAIIYVWNLGSKALLHVPKAADSQMQWLPVR